MPVGASKSVDDPALVTVAELGTVRQVVRATEDEDVPLLPECPPRQLELLAAKPLTPPVEAELGGNLATHVVIRIVHVTPFIARIVASCGTCWFCTSAYDLTSRRDNLYFTKVPSKIKNRLSMAIDPGYIKTTMVLPKV